MTEYTIVGDFDICGSRTECLIAVAGEWNAEEVLARVKADPGSYKAQQAENIRIKVEEVRDPWYRDPFLVN